MAKGQLRGLVLAVSAVALLVMSACGSAHHHEGLPAAKRTRQTPMLPSLASVSVPAPSPSSSASASASASGLRAPYIVVCTFGGADGDAIILSFYNALTGGLIKTNYDVDPFNDSSFKPSTTGSCHNLSFNGAFTELAGTDSDGTPAALNISSGAVTDEAPNPQSTGFDAAPQAEFVSEAFNPTNNDFWYVQAKSNSAAVLGGQSGNLYHHVENPDSDGTDASESGAVNWYFPFKGSVPYVDYGGSLLLPNGKVGDGDYDDLPKNADQQEMDSSLLPPTNYSINNIRLSDNGKQAAFVAETDSADPLLELFTVPATGGEPSQIGGSLNLPLPKYNEGASEPEVVRYVQG